jgi:hypothetical protein
VRREHDIIGPGQVLVGGIFLRDNTNYPAHFIRLILDAETEDFRGTGGGSKKCG